MHPYQHLPPERLRPLPGHPGGRSRGRGGSRRLRRRRGRLGSRGWPEPSPCYLAARTPARPYPAARSPATALPTHPRPRMDRRPRSPAPPTQQPVPGPTLAGQRRRLPHPGPPPKRGTATASPEPGTRSRWDSPPPLYARSGHQPQNLPRGNPGRKHPPCLPDPQKFYKQKSAGGRIGRPAGLGGLAARFNLGGPWACVGSAWRL